MRKRSKSFVVRHALDVNAWRVRSLSVDAARPSACVGCKAASRPVGQPLGLHGHGVRERQLRGPVAVGRAPEIITVVVRRYRCRHCGAVMTIVPRGVIPKMLYAAGPIALALFLYGVELLPTREVRSRVSPWKIVGESTGWPSLRRWLAAPARMWRTVRASPEHFSSRQRAERVATSLAGHAPPGERDLGCAAFVGAARAL